MDIRIEGRVRFRSNFFEVEMEIKNKGGELEVYEPNAEVEYSAGARLIRTAA